MIKKFLIYGTLIAALNMPVATRDPSNDKTVRQEIHNLEMRITEKAERQYTKKEGARFIVYENPSIYLGDNADASVLIVYDKENKSYRYFNINVNSRYFRGKPLEGMQTIERYYDSKMDGYEFERTGHSEDLFTEYSIKQGRVPRGNKLHSMTSDEVVKLNMHLRDRLLQIHQARHY
jgi:hypothetical protein